MSKGLEFIEIGIVSVQGGGEFVKAKLKNGSSVLQDDDSSLLVLSVDIGQAGKRKLDQFEGPQFSSPIAFILEHYLQDESFNEGLGVVGVEAMGKLLLLSHARIGMLLVYPEEHSEAYFFEQEEAVA